MSDRFPLFRVLPVLSLALAGALPDAFAAGSAKPENSEKAAPPGGTTSG